MRVKARCPSESALNMATRSAQTVSPYVAFSTLQPVTIVPSSVSSAAPTLKCEYGATACSRARRAAATSAARAASTRDERSEPANDALQESDELAAHAARRFHHFVVMQRLWQHTRGHVRDARNAQHLEPHVPR